jgi:hypothetical protein
MFDRTALFPTNTLFAGDGTATGAGLSMLDKKLVE